MIKYLIVLVLDTVRFVDCIAIESTWLFEFHMILNFAWFLVVMLPVIFLLVFKVAGIELSSSSNTGLSFWSCPWTADIVCQCCLVQCAAVSAGSHFIPYGLLFLSLIPCLIIYSSASQSVLLPGSHGIRDKFPGDPLLHFSNGCSVIYLFLN